MTYEELIAKVLNGKSINARAKELGMPQKTLDNYVRGRSAPGCGVTMMFAEIAGVSLQDAVAAVAEQEKKARPNHSATFLRPAMASVLMAVSFVLVAATGLLPAGNANAASIDVGSKTTASANSLFSFPISAYLAESRRKQPFLSGREIAIAGICNQAIDDRS